jgi:hypothetical protein
VNFTRDYRSKQGAQVFGSARLRAVAIVCFCWLVTLSETDHTCVYANVRVYSPAIQYVDAHRSAITISQQGHALF